MTAWIQTGFPNDGSLAGGLGASSSDGTKLVASSMDEFGIGYLWISLNSGSTWTKTTTPGSRRWYGLAISADGTVIYAVSTGTATLWKSSDTGSTWTEITNSSIAFPGQYGLACSSDGSIVYMTDTDPDVLRISTNGGSSWSTKSVGTNPNYLACDSDGSVVVINADEGIYVSTDSAASFTLSLTGNGASYVACSSTGAYILIAGGDIQYSTNTGSTWTNVTNDPTWSDANPIVSDDGSVMMCQHNNGGPSTLTYFSNNSGSTWTTNEDISVYLISANSTANKLFGWYYENPAQIWSTFSGALPSNSFYIDSINPNTGTTSGATPVTIAGNWFNPLATAAIDGNNLTDITVVDSTTLTGITPAGTLGSKDVTVTNP